MLTYDKYWEEVRNCDELQRTLTLHLTLKNIPKDLIEWYLSLSEEQLQSILDGGQQPA